MTFKVQLHHYGRFTIPHGRRFVDGMVATTDPVELESFSTNQMKLILTNCLGYDENSVTFLYIKKPGCSLDSCLIPLDDAIQDNELILTYTQTQHNRLHVYISRVELSPLVADDQSKYEVSGKLQIYAAHHPIDLSTVLISNDGSLKKSFAGIISEETILKQKESLSYLHQMQKQNKRFDYHELLGKLGFIDKTKPTKPYTQTAFNFLVHNKGQLVNGDKKDLVYVNGGTINITISRMKLQEMKQYLFNILGKNINALYYRVPHNGFSITIKQRNNYDMHVMFDISSARGKLEIYIDHIDVNFIIQKYIYRNSDLAQMMNHVITDYTSDTEDERKEVTQNDYTYDQMIEWAEQEHFEDEETKEVHYHTEIWKNRIYNMSRLETSRGVDDEYSFLSIVAFFIFKIPIKWYQSQVKPIMPGRGRPRNTRQGGDPAEPVAIRDPRDIEEIESLQQWIRELKLQQDKHNEETESNSVVWDDGFDREKNPFGRRPPPQARSQNRGDILHSLGVRVEILKFMGTAQPDEFIDWISTVERVFDLRDIPDNPKVKVVAIKLRKYASLWWDHVKHKRCQQGLDPHQLVFGKTHKERFHGHLDQVCL
nr:reverse transcriptase domain-containing protein [Tanacetum cinerariifolium]